MITLLTPAYGNESEAALTDTVRVMGKVSCPKCGGTLTASARFQWGAVPGWTSELGSESVWVRDESDRPYLPFIVVLVDGRRPMWNFGDPRYRHVILLDEDLFEGDRLIDCPACGTRIAAISCTVRDGFYRELNALEDWDLQALVGSSRGKANAVVVREDGSFWPREDWLEGGLAHLDEAFGETTIPLSEVPWLTLDASKG